MVVDMVDGTLRDIGYLRVGGEGGRYEVVPLLIEPVDDTPPVIRVVQNCYDGFRDRESR